MRKSDNTFLNNPGVIEEVSSGILKATELNKNEKQVVILCGMQRRQPREGSW